MSEQFGKAKVKILSDKPSKKDWIGTHAPIAKAIADLIDGSGADAGSKTVFLTGDWGSGKSTVVELLRGELKERKLNKKIRLFHFDAWEHEGELLKRAFLERLVDYCLENHLIVDLVHRRKWTYLRKTMFCQRSHVTPVPTASTIILIVLTLLSLSVIQTIQDHKFLFWSLPDNLPSHYLWYAEASPLIWAVIVAMAGIIWWLWTMQERNQGRNLNLWSILKIGGSSSINSSLTEHDPVPSSIDFEKYYYWLLSDVFYVRSFINKLPEWIHFPKTINCEQLILVLDNLDRLDKSKRQACWDDLQVFCSGGSRAKELAQKEPDQREQVYKRLWLLVPYNQFQDNPIDTIRKVSQVSFNVPPLILTHWWEYLKRELKEALFAIKLSEETLESICRIFYFMTDNNPALLSLRNIKTFVNSLSASYLRWAGSKPLIIQAWHALLVQSDIWAVDKLFMQNSDRRNIPPDVKLNEWGEYGWEGILASIHLGVDDSAKALQVILEPIVGNALDNGSDASVQKLKNYKTVPGLNIILAALVRDRVQRTPTAIALAAKALGVLDIPKGDHYIDNAWVVLMQQADKVDWNIPKPSTVAEGLGYIRARIKSEQKEELGK